MTGCWVPGAGERGFPVEVLPFGAVRAGGGPVRLAVAVGDCVLDLGAAAVGEPFAPLFAGPRLNPFLAAGPVVWRQVRSWLATKLCDDVARPALEPHLSRAADVQVELCVDVADYVDFYSSEHHATNVGRIFRPDGAPLAPNWRHLPVGYHGRAGTIVVSGTPVVRPCGQRRQGGSDRPAFGPTTQLDYEAEVAFVVGVGTPSGTRVAAAELRSHVFGLCLLNDWSARDVQAWESTPLGPFLGKAFATSVSPWLVPLDALEAAWVPAPPRSVPPLPHLADTGPGGLDLALEVEWNGTVVARPPFASMYWTPGQQLAHLTSGGAHLRTGDVFASGTVSGPERDQRGSLLELTWGGREPVRLADGTLRTYCEDGDTVTIRASAPGVTGRRIPLGEVTGTVRPARC